MRMLSVLFVFAIFFGLSTSPGAAGDKDGPEKAYLKALVGEWDASVKFMGGESKGSNSTRMLGDRWVVSDFKGEFGGQAFQGHAVSGYDTDKKKITGIWVDTMGSGIMNTEGTVDKSGKVFTEVGEGTMNGEKFKHKMVTKLVDKDTIVFEMFNAEGDASAMMTITYKRKK